MPTEPIYQKNNCEGIAVLIASQRSILHVHYHATLSVRTPNPGAPVNGKNHEREPLSLLLEGENVGDLLLLKCIQFPKPAEPVLQTARYMITLCDPNHCPSQRWQLFKNQFNLTPDNRMPCI